MFLTRHRHLVRFKNLTGARLIVLHILTYTTTNKYFTEQFVVKNTNFSTCVPPLYYVIVK